MRGEVINAPRWTSTAADLVGQKPTYTMIVGKTGRRETDVTTDDEGDAQRIGCRRRRYLTGKHFSKTEDKKLLTNAFPLPSSALMGFGNSVFGNIGMKCCEVSKTGQTGAKKKWPRPTQAILGGNQRSLAKVVRETSSTRLLL